MTTPLRLAMWSGPRNISTAMMRAWENRSDTAVWDEPFYAYFLRQTGLEHPGAEEVIAAGEPDWQEVVARMTGSVPGRKAIFFQKHMSHHLLPKMSWNWLDEVTSCFLIRDPREVIASYVKTRPEPTLYDIGVVQQAEIFERVCERSRQTPLVIDSRDVLENPRALLSTLCKSLGVSFEERMLSWPSGPRSSDGVWAKHWYASVLETTGFEPYETKARPLSEGLEPLAEECVPYYRALHAARLRPCKDQLL